MPIAYAWASSGLWSGELNCLLSRPPGVGEVKPWLYLPEKWLWLSPHLCGATGTSAAPLPPSLSPLPTGLQQALITPNWPNHILFEDLEVTAEIIYQTPTLYGGEMSSERDVPRLGHRADGWPRSN